MSSSESEQPTAQPRRGAPIPCRLCGYHAPLEDCPHCGHAPLEPSLAGRLGTVGQLAAGATALFRGAGFLMTTPGTKRWLVPPTLATVLAFAVVTSLLWKWIDGALHGIVPEDIDLSAQLPAWLAVVVEWPIKRGLALFAAKAAGAVATLLVAALVWWFAFSLVFEAIAGPFLDEIQGRTEARWFGSDPRNRLERPPGSDAQLNLRASLVAGAAGCVGAVVAASVLSGWSLLLVAAAALAPAVVTGLVLPRYGRWLFWVASVELRALRASLAGLAVSGFLLVFFLPIYLVPFIGPYIYAVGAGFATSITLLDLPFSRRGLTFRQRLSLLRSNAATMTIYGLTCGLLFGIPFIGPLFVVPSASVGGQWLFCRLDKTLLRESALPR